MTFITFIYKVGQDSKTYYGKYCTDYVSDDHEGLDNEVKYHLMTALNKYNASNDNTEILESDVSIGVISFSTNRYISTYSTDSEIECFDFYHNYENEMYINGVLV